MKKTTRILALTAAVCLLTLSFSGCNQLDDMRKNHGVWNPDGSIQIGNSQYLLLPSSDALSPILSESVTITDADVPLLLSAFCGKCMDRSKDGIFLRDNDIPYSESSIPTYCRADQYDAVLAEMRDKTAYTTYYYEYLQYMPQTGYETIRHILTADDVQTLENVMKTENSLHMDLTQQENTLLVSLWRGSANGWFCDPDFFYNIYQIENVYYVTKEDLVYRVPGADAPVFDRMLEAYRNSIGE